MSEQLKLIKELIIQVDPKIAMYVLQDASDFVAMYNSKLISESMLDYELNNLIEELNNEIESGSIKAGWISEDEVLNG